MPARTWGVRVGVVEEVLEEVQAVFGDHEDVVVVEVRLEGLAAVYDQGMSPLLTLLAW